MTETPIPQLTPPQKKRRPWICRLPKAGRMIFVSTFFALLGIAALFGGLLYIDRLQDADFSSTSIISEAFKTLNEFSGERAFKGNERMNILCLGIDYNRDSRGMAYSKGARSDTIFVISIDSKGQTLNVVSIPRDCYVYLGDAYGYDKINAAYMYGGIDLAKKVVSDFLGVPIQHYVIIRVQGAKELVDALGGLVIDVEKDMDYDDNWGNLHIHLKAGEQLLRGEQAVGYARFRMDAESDRGRIRRQQQVMAAVIRRLKDPLAVLRLQSIVKAVKQNIETDFSLLDMLDLTYLYKDFDRKRMKTGVIVGDDTDINGMSCIIPYAPVNEKTVLELLKDPSNLQRGDVRLEVLNGSSEEGLEGKVAEYLTREGFKVVKLGVSEQPYEVTTIYDHLDSIAIRSSLEHTLIGSHYIVEPLSSNQREADITIIVGQDRADYQAGQSLKSPRERNYYYDAYDPQPPSSPEPEPYYEPEPYQEPPQLEAPPTPEFAPPQYVSEGEEAPAEGEAAQSESASPGEEAAPSHPQSEGEGPAAPEEPASAPVEAQLAPAPEAESAPSPGSSFEETEYPQAAPEPAPEAPPPPAVEVPESGDSTPAPAPAVVDLE